METQSGASDCGTTDLYEQLARLEDRCEQLLRAVRGQVIIEQAKGAVSVRCGVTPQEAFELIRGLSRSQSREIHGFCAEIIANGGRLDGLAQRG